MQNRKKNHGPAENEKNYDFLNEIDLIIVNQDKIFLSESGCSFQKTKA